MRNLSFDQNMKNDMERNILLFDLDGTLIDSKRTIAMYFVRTLDQLKISHRITEKKVAENLENSFEDINREFELNMNEKEFKIFVDTYRKNYLKDPLPGTKIYPWVKRTLATLKKRNFKIALATGKQIEVAQKSLKDMKLDIFFDHIQGWEPGLKAKPEPDILQRAVKKISGNEQNAVMIGDTYVDIQAGQAMGIPTIAVLYGFGQRKTLKKYSPDYFMNSFNELPGILESINKKSGSARRKK